MREVVALTLRHLREVRRSPGVRWTVGVGGLAFASVLLVAGTAPGLVLGGGLLVAGVLAVGVAARSGGLLPEDRAEGREPWLATTAPSGAQRRVAAALAGAVLAGVAALAGTAAVALGAALRAPEAGVREYAALTTLDRVRLVAGRTHVVPLPRSEAARLLEVVFRPLVLDTETGGDPATVAWRIEPGGIEGQQRLEQGARLRVDLPAGAEAVALENGHRGVQLAVREAGLLGAHQPLALSLFWAFLALGALAIAVVPVAVFLSRATSAATATTATFVLTLSGLFPPLIEDAALVGGAAEGVGATVVRTAAWLAPDLSVLGALALPPGGRAIERADLGGLAPLLVYAAVGLLLVALPRPRRSAS